MFYLYVNKYVAFNSPV